ncbi:NIPSNAP family protein [Microlunatus flavus]|uniref:NIPSNAP protein n=1 Tax=Microlunatus flavus TaxID=1036181 RepID=A0A1H9L8M6_9ACTN|nr:NIPSNAP family protein [Microlunatus flavus]SER07353.1 NIPSNAP protein [Microlunatus flavus]
MDVIELRQYTLHRGQRDVLVELFDSEFVEPQEAAGIRVLGQFRDLDDDDRFVWFRGFEGMASRGPALAAFYGGPVWRSHRDKANATMVDSDDVLLLRPVRGSSGWCGPPASTFSQAGEPCAPPLLVASIFNIAGSASASRCLRFLTEVVEPLEAAAGVTTVALLETEPRQNNFPALPVREGETVLVRVARYPDVAVHRRLRRALRHAPGWHAFTTCLQGEPDERRLAPTEGSALR